MFTGPSWTPHHTNYTAGYMDSVRDVNRVLVNSPDLHPATRSDLSHFISIKQGMNQGICVPKKAKYVSSKYIANVF